MSKRVVVTGLGLLSPAGLSAESFWSALRSGPGTPGDVSLFDTGPFRHKRAFQVPEFALQDYVTEVGMHRMERFSKLVLAAGTIALQDAGLTADGTIRDRVGSILTTVYGPVNVTVKYLKDLIHRGPAQVSPIYFQQTVMNVAGGQLSIKYQLKGVSSTLVGSSSVAYACDLIRSGRADAVLAIGVEELCEQVFHAYSGNGFLDQLTLGEGCGVVVLECAEHARKRGARVYGQLEDYVTFADGRMNRHVATLEGGPESAIHHAMGRWVAPDGIRASEIGLVSCLANGMAEVDAAERTALRALYGPEVPTLQVKARVGEALGASEVLSLIATLMCLDRGEVPGSGGARPLTGPYAVCNSMFVGGSVSSLLLRRAG